MTQEVTPSSHLINFEVESLAATSEIALTFCPIEFNLKIFTATQEVAPCVRVSHTIKCRDHSSNLKCYSASLIKLQVNK